jgi:hypothetical protein
VATRCSLAIERALRAALLELKTDADVGFGSRFSSTGFGAPATAERVRNIERRLPSAASPLARFRA